MEEINIQEFAVALVNRLSWDMLKTVLDSHEIIRSNSRERTITNIVDSLSLNNPATLSRLQSLWEIYKDTVLFGDKAVRFFKVGEDDTHNLIHLINETKIPQNVFSKSFPLPQNQEVLKKHYDENKIKPQPVYKENYPDGSVLLAFTASRFFIEQHKFDKDWLLSKQIQQLSEFDEVVAKQNVYRDACDFILIRPSENIIEIGIDHPDTSGIFSQSMIQKDNAFKALLSYVTTELTACDKERTVSLSSPIVLFDAIRSFFESSDGRIFRVRFLTADGLDDHPNMTNYKKDNYREASFYQGGRQKVDSLTPYRISIVWDRIENNITRYPFVNLLGKKSMLNSSKGRLEEAMFSNVMGQSDYRFAVDKLFSKLN